MKSFGKQLLLSLICTVALTAPTYAVDGCSSASFKVGTSINLEATPVGLASADFNGDGHLDLAASPSDISGEVIVLLGGGGTERFGPPTGFRAGGLPRRLAAGDFNGDGKADLVLSLEGFSLPASGRLSILLNDGTGKFGTPNIINLSGTPGRPVLADINNDGKLDIVIDLSTGTPEGKIAVLLGNGTGGFAHAVNSPFSTFSINAVALGIGDFNEDGKRDLAIPGSSGGLDILLGNGAGGFAPGVNTPTGGNWLSVTIADFNKDGHLDVLMDDRMLLGTGTGNFSAPIIVPIPPNSGAALVTDVNHDSHLDVIVSAFSGMTIMFGNSTGNFVRGKSYTSGFLLFPSGFAFAVPGDFNEDGKVDVAAVQRLGISVLDGDGSGEFADGLSYHSSGGGPTHLVSADFNNDGKQDIAFSKTIQGAQSPAPSGVEIALGDGTGGFTRKAVSSFGVSFVGMLATGDFDSNGKVDLAVIQPSDGRISILLNDGTGGFPAEGFNAPNIFVGLLPTTLASGDFNNDTKADLVVVTGQSNSYVVLVGNGSGGFTSLPAVQLQGNASFADHVGIGDFNADGKSDLAVVRSGDSVVYVLHGDGTGHFSPNTTLSITGTPTAVVVRDLSGDGKPDIAVTNGVLGSFNPSMITVFINNGAPGFNAGTSYPTDNSGTLATGDFNNDNQPDLVVGSGFLNNLEGISVLSNNGNGTFNAPLNFAVGQRPGQVVAGDFNNDGEDDVVMSQPAGFSIGLVLNNFTTAKPCLSVGDVTITENDSGTINANFTVTLSAASAQTVRVNYFAFSAFGALSPFASQAAKGLDFENVPGTLIFLPGVTEQVFSIPIKGDTTDEFDQVFFVALTTPINAVISDGRGLGTIVDNDAPPVITINDVSVVENTQLLANFTVSLSAHSEKPVSVEYALQPGTALSNVDYTDISGTINFTFGLSQTISVPIIQDNIFETDETFFVNLTNATNATIADPQGQGTITNDDSQPTITMPGFVPVTEGAAGTTVNVPFTITLSNPSHQTITVAFATEDLTATAGSDYAATSGTLTFNPGETSKPILVQVNGDNVDELNERFFLNLSNPTNTTLPGPQIVGQINDDDGPTMSIANMSVTEGHTGVTTADFTVSLSGPSVQEIFVDYAVTSGTANSSDFQRLSFGPAVIPAGATSTTIPIRIFGDFQIEPDEQFTVTLLLATNATIAGQSVATGTILNDDSNGKLQFSSPTFTAIEDGGSAIITVFRVDGATGTVTVDFATSNGTATAGSDYVAASGTLTFIQGETTKTFSVPVISDQLFESEETVNLTLSNPTGGATLGTSATLTIKGPKLFLALEELALDPNRIAAVDSLLWITDPFPVIQPLDLLNPSVDRNTRVVVFVTGLQSAPGDLPSVVRVHLVDSNGQSFDVGAEDVRAGSVLLFRQVTFRLPNTIAAGVCTIKIQAHDQESNVGTIRIKN